MQIGDADRAHGFEDRPLRKFLTDYRRRIGLAVVALGLAAGVWRFGHGQAVADHTYDPAAITDRWMFQPPVGHRTEHPILLAFQRDWGQPSGDDRAIAPGAWKARMTALCGLAKLGPAVIPVLLDALDAESDEVRDLAAQASGYFGDRSILDRLKRTIREDPSAVVRVYASIAIGSIAGDLPQELARDILRHDPHAVVRARLELALSRGEPIGDHTTRDRLASYDLALMDTARVGAAAPDFVLSDLSGKPCRLSDFRGKKSVALVFIYGAPCMFCTGHLANMRSKLDEFEALGTKVLVVEANEPYRVRATARAASIPAQGDPRLPILFDSAHTVAATYGVAMQMNHVEWLNRPSTFLIDRQGIIRKAFLAKSPDDRPSSADLVNEVRAMGDELTVAKVANPPAAIGAPDPLRGRAAIDPT